MTVKALYVDGGVIGSNPSPIGGTWAWCHVDHADHRTGGRIKTGSGIVLPHDRYVAITNNYTEMLALVEGIESLPEGWSGKIYSDSEVTLGRAFRGHSINGIPPEIVERMLEGIARLNYKKLEWSLLKGHPSRLELSMGYSSKGVPCSWHNVWCDQECKALAAALQQSMRRGL